MSWLKTDKIRWLLSDDLLTERRKVDQVIVISNGEKRSRLGGQAMMPSQNPTIASDRDHVLAALESARHLIMLSPARYNDEARSLVERIEQESIRVQQANSALIVSLLSDDYHPCELFKPWASVRRFQQWRDDPSIKVDVVIRHGRTCVRPGVFFAFWKTLPNETKIKIKVNIKSAD